VREKSEWVPAIKLSETPQKTLNPGNKKAWRLYDKRGNATADLLTLNEPDFWDTEVIKLHHPLDHTKFRLLRRVDISKTEPLLVEILKEGDYVYDFPSIEEIKRQRTEDIERLDPGVRRIVNPHFYHVSLSDKLWNLKQDLVKSLKNEE
jgi:nicotinate phosphoribosyltransferase